MVFRGSGLMRAGRGRKRRGTCVNSKCRA